MSKNRNAKPSEDDREQGRRQPSGFTKFLSVILAILIVLLVPLSLLAWDIYRVVFDEPLVTRIITEITCESDLIPVALEWYAELRAQVRADTTPAIPWVDEPDIIELLALLGLDEWRAERDVLLPCPIVAPMVSASTRGTYEWIDNEARNPDISWEMQPLIDHVSGDAGHEAIEIVYQVLEPCVDEQIDDFLARLDAAPVGKEVPYNLCEFPEPWTEDQYTDYHAELVETVAQIPPTFHLTETLMGTEDVAQGVGPLQLKAQLRLIRTIGKWAWVIAALLLLIALLWGLKRWRAFGIRWGTALLIGGAILIALALLYPMLIIGILGRGPLSEAPPIVMQEAELAVVRIGQHIFKPALIQGIICAVVALIGIILVLVFRREKDEKEPQDKEIEALEGTPPEHDEAEAPPED